MINRITIVSTLNKYYKLNCSKFDVTKRKLKQELCLSKELARALSCVAEYKAPYNFGRIDCYSKDWLIEAKYCSNTNEKHALGQLLCYEFSLKFKGQLGLALIGTGRLCESTKLFCKSKGITIFYFNVNEQKPRWRLHTFNPSNRS